MSHIVWEHHEDASEGSGSSQGGSSNSLTQNENSDSLAAPNSTKLRKAQVLKYEGSSSGSEGASLPANPRVTASSGKQGKTPHTETPEESLAVQAGESVPVPSVGSEKHGIGECRPCAWFWKPLGCRSGSSCTYCHLCTKEEFEQKAAARKKARAARWRADKKQTAAAALAAARQMEQEEE
mmetsp:Transcript_73133/g.136700  ORF Transcript_73133/g.136700 Transcript_73133/m.136700 type:complete len:181 (-) Transcript_73133:83-625(-)